ncbi:hypothetical protein RclHR1_03590008 [Rhizophagus clarus]|uniref:Crinkler (CRN) family protein n=1 Tax=Rhizophagus clarus TaxID=94130 RepID=A0A2Z6RBW9_9GLOM|nr:hypothetical protein RclHR1_03590008 [Rhizophagus clarus]GET01613.1 crinkler (CRN) family protein [Rhizophagus clarus]
MVGCFILGSCVTFNFEIGKYIDFTELKKAIWEEDKDYFVSIGVKNDKKIKLWKVEIPTRNNDKYERLLENPRVDLNVKEEFSGERLDETWHINLTFEEHPPKEHIHIIVQPLPPATIDLTRKRQIESYMISTTGPIYLNEKLLSVPVPGRKIFRDVKNDFVEGYRSFIIHGPYQSGKTSFLLHLKESLRKERLNYVFLDMATVTSQMKKVEDIRQGFFNIMSFYMFQEYLSEDDTYKRIEQELDYLYILIDEFQLIFTNDILLSVSKDFFRSISTYKLPYVAVGTFLLFDLLTCDLGSPFNKATFKQMPAFDNLEMSKLFFSYKNEIPNPKGLTVPLDLQRKIMKESCGHPASFMILLKIFDDENKESTPLSLDKWEIVLEEKLDSYLNGTYIKLRSELMNMNSNEKQYVCKLTTHMGDEWFMNLIELDDLNKKLLNIGILTHIAHNNVRFTSYIILRKCIETVWPQPIKLKLKENEVPVSPMDLLMLGLQHIDPTTIVDDRVKNVDGPAENSIQVALYCVFNGLLPRPFKCLLEIKCGGKDKLDLMIVKDRNNLVAYSLNVNNITLSDFRSSLEQASKYVKQYKMEVYLLNFYLDGHRTPEVIHNIPQGIILVNIKHNNDFTKFYITSGCFHSMANVIKKLHSYT